VVRNFGYQFRSPCDLLNIQSVWQALGGYDWRLLDSADYGVHLVGRDSKKNLRIRVLGEKSDYTLEAEVDVDNQQVDETMKQLFQDVFEKLLPSVDAVSDRDSDIPFLSSLRHLSNPELER